MYGLPHQDIAKLDATQDELEGIKELVLEYLWHPALDPVSRRLQD